MLPTFKIRCSAIGEIMAYAGKPQIPVGAQTYLKKWCLEQLYGRCVEVHGAALRKGNEVEQAAIDLAQSQLEPDGIWFKNNQHFSNDHLTGTPDIVNGSKVIDIKCPLSFASFPMFDTELPTKDYNWQLQGYMALTECTSAAVVYCLMDAPEAIIADEARKLSYQLGFGGNTDQTIETVMRQMTYPDVPDHLRVKIFEVKRDNEMIDQIYDRVWRMNEFAQQWLAPYADRFAGLPLH
jgi:hypothetical protein